MELHCKNLVLSHRVCNITASGCRDCSPLDNFEESSSLLPNGHNLSSLGLEVFFRFPHFRFAGDLSLLEILPCCRIKLLCTSFSNKLIADCCSNTFPSLHDLPCTPISPSPLVLNTNEGTKMSQLGVIASLLLIEALFDELQYRS